VIRSFRHKGLRDLFINGSEAGIRADLAKRVLRILNVLQQAQSLKNLNFPGFGVHPLHTTPKRYAISVNGPWRVTFEWVDGDAWRVDDVHIGRRCDPPFAR
jgi:proteic killer suppression protein